MKEGIFQVTLFDAKTNNPFKETELNGESFVIVEPGNEYYVTVAVHRSSLQESWAYKYLRIGLFVDGFDVQYWKRLDFTDASATAATSLYAKFWGFKKNESEFRSFVFTDPSSGGNANTDNSSSSSRTTKSETNAAPRPIGQIRVIIHDADVVQGIFENKCGKDAILTVSSLKQGIGPTEDRKFWMQPSIGTTAGSQVVGKDHFKPVVKWQNRSNVPLRTMLLTYHTRLTYELLEQYSKQTKPKASFANSSNRPGVDELMPPKRACIQNIVVDLTAEDDDEQGQRSHGTPSKSTAGPPRVQHSEEALNDDVLIVNVPKTFEILDITNDNEKEPVWKSFSPTT